ncbi:kinase-like protein [Microthyrium microscopicum]|uniref:Kinase-like protein n=1 Tax=Microthyrium microscopicum TaxID=703497 RepID=A0A6A6U5B0_9PEZI|nr:kinase-like protein [Microthyrium microscopicum]
MVRTRNQDYGLPAPVQPRQRVTVSETWTRLSERPFFLNQIAGIHYRGRRDEHVPVSYLVRDRYAEDPAFIPGATLPGQPALLSPVQANDRRAIAKAAATAELQRQNDIYADIMCKQLPTADAKAENEALELDGQRNIAKRRKLQYVRNDDENIPKLKKAVAMRYRRNKGMNKTTLMKWERARQRQLRELLARFGANIEPDASGACGRVHKLDREDGDPEKPDCYALKIAYKFSFGHELEFLKKFTRHNPRNIALHIASKSEKPSNYFINYCTEWTDEGDLYKWSHRYGLAARTKDMPSLPEGSSGPQRPQSLDEKQVWQLLKQMLEALMFLHNGPANAASWSPIIHYDIKPGNILAYKTGPDNQPVYTFKIADFGHAHYQGDIHGSVGTYVYGPPEMVRRLDKDPFIEARSGDALTTACDVFGLGMTIHTILTNQTARWSIREICEDFEDNTLRVGIQPINVLPLHVLNKLPTRDNHDDPANHFRPGGGPAYQNEILEGAERTMMVRTRKYSPALSYLVYRLCSPVEIAKKSQKKFERYTAVEALVYVNTILNEADASSKSFEDYVMSQRKGICDEIADFHWTRTRRDFEKARTLVENYLERNGGSFPQPVIDPVYATTQQGYVRGQTPDRPFKNALKGPRLRLTINADPDRRRAIEETLRQQAEERQDDEDEEDEDEENDDEENEEEEDDEEDEEEEDEDDEDQEDEQDEDEQDEDEQEEEEQEEDTAVKLNQRLANNHQNMAPPTVPATTTQTAKPPHKMVGFSGKVKPRPKR